MFNLSRFSLKDKVAIVTGGSRGIGQAIAYGYAAAGARVVLTSRKIEDLETTAARIREQGGDAFAVAAHLGKMDQIQKVVDAAMEKYGRIDILVNNAGTNPQGTSMESDERLWDVVMNLNLKGLFFLTQAVAKIMKEQRSGKIINISSIGGIKPTPFVSVYSVSKAGVCMITKLFAMELAPYNIQVNTIAPGMIVTKMVDPIWSRLPEEEAKKTRAALESTLPMGRLGEPDEIVGTAVYLASDASSYTSGAEIIVDGALILRDVDPKKGK